MSLHSCPCSYEPPSPHTPGGNYPCPKRPSRPSYTLGGPHHPGASMEVPARIPPPGITLLPSPDVPSAACSLSRCHFPRHCHPPLWNTLQPRPWPDHSAGHENGQGLASAGLLGTLLGGGSPAPVSLIPTTSQGPYGPPGNGSASPRLSLGQSFPPGTTGPNQHIPPV